ncbi:predicted protein [Verticillium alfalfae VaMs.102]|uniref:Predicted protein n=1 Tax=Verticillium alfalfae (strain VaMs.102 / ATCC MYA-4576 / FGSC 10136) TaxID=526221 RepID=C9SFS7_VERA1|nr:predicted protein [Verticillium alfalfae VaMs.102]EEY18022.1 predicted protein [Verticillium alfalfae VaMs.102]
MRPATLRILTLIAEFYHKLDYHLYRRQMHQDSNRPIAKLAAEPAARCAGSVCAIVFGHTHADELMAGLWTVGTQTFERDDRLFEAYFARETRSVGVKPLHGQRQLARSV